MPIEFAIQPSKSLTPAKKTAAQVEELTKQTLAITRLNDKELTEREIDYERHAIVLNITEFPRIHPMKATIGFMVRNTKGGNSQVVEYIRAALPSKASKEKSLEDIVNLISMFDKLDESSQNRIDCLDWLCRKYDITVLDFLRVMKIGIGAFCLAQDIMVSSLIAEKRPELADKIFKDAMGEGIKASGNKRLAAEISGLASKEPIVSIDQSSKVINNNTTNQNVILSFSDFIKKNDKEVRNEQESKHFDVEAEIVNE